MSLQPEQIRCALEVTQQLIAELDECGALVAEAGERITYVRCRLTLAEALLRNEERLLKERQPSMLDVLDWYTVIE
jgi:hypothetical protein